MRKIIVGVIAVACTLSTFAMEDVNKDSVGAQPLKFTVNNNAKTVEDAPGSHLIQTFQMAVVNIDVYYGALIEKNEKELQNLDSTLKEMQQGSIERFGAELYRAKLTRKIEKLAKQRKRFFEGEPFLQEVLQIILHPSSNLASYCQGYCGVAPNIDVFKKKPFKDVDFNSYYSYGPEGDDVGEGFLKLKIDAPISMDINNKLQSYFNPHGFGWDEMGVVQREMLEKGELIYRISTHSEGSLSSNKSLILQVMNLARIDAPNVRGKTVLEIFKQDIDKLTLKVEKVLIPRSEISHLMGKIIMAFQEEAPRHREQAQGSSGQ